MVGTFVWFQDTSGGTGAVLGEETGSSVTSMFDDTSSGLVADLTVSTSPDRITYERWSVDLPEWKPIHDTVADTWDSDNSFVDNNELCGCCDAVGILDMDNAAFAHEGTFLPVKVSVTNNGKKVMGDTKLVIPETPHDNCWWMLHAEEDEDGNLVWTFPDGTVMDTYFGVDIGYTAAAVAGGDAYSDYDIVKTNAGIMYYFNGYKVTHVPLALDNDSATYGGITTIDELNDLMDGSGTPTGWSAG